MCLFVPLNNAKDYFYLMGLLWTHYAFFDAIIVSIDIVWRVFESVCEGIGLTVYSVMEYIFMSVPFSAYHIIMIVGFVLFFGIVYLSALITHRCLFKGTTYWLWGKKASKRRIS